MQYFDFSGLNDFLFDTGKAYNNNSSSAKWYIDTRSKLQYLITLLSSKLDVKLINNYNEKPNRQAGQGKPFTLKPYILAGFIPQKFQKLDKKAFIKLSFFPGEAGSFQFGIDVDVNFSDDKNPYTKNRDVLQRDTKWEIPVNEAFPSTWESLMDLISPIVKERIDYFEDYFGNNKATSKVEEPNSTYKTAQSGTMHPLNQILFGPPGTGKTFTTIEKAIQIANPSFDLVNKTRKQVKDEFRALIGDGRVVFTTFHQSMSYEDFIEGIKPSTTPDNEVIYEVTDGLFKKLCAKASEKKVSSSNFEDAYQKFLKEISDNSGKLVLETLKHSKEFTVYKNSKNNIKFHANTEKAYEGVIRKEVLEHFLKTGETLDWPSYVKAIGNYLQKKYKYTQSEEAVERNVVLIIDEINRGNVSQIFGELITLIEDDKRLGKDEELEVVLPYSKERFGVPANLYIIGTMNTADRSVEALDTALRRRFHFEEMAPDSSLIGKNEKLDPPGMLSGINLVQLLDKINARLEKLLDKDHLIGHSFFIKVDSIEKLKEAFQNKIIPLLQEYFYGDFGKIGLVLGSGFVRTKSTEKIENLFAKPEYGFDIDSFEEKLVFDLIDHTKTSDPSFEEAIASLLK